MDRIVEARTLLPEDFRAIVGDRKIENYVETGLWKGDQLAQAALVFDFLWGIELDPDLAEQVARRFAEDPSVLVFNAPSEGLLPKLAPSIEGATFFYLDAHYCELDPPIAKSPFPLWEELAAIRERGNAEDIIYVDDAHTFGKERPELRWMDVPDWEGVTVESLQKFMGDRYETQLVKGGLVLR